MWLLPAKKIQNDGFVVGWLGGTSQVESLDFGIFENIAKIQMMVMMV